MIQTVPARDANGSPTQVKIFAPTPNKDLYNINISRNAWGAVTSVTDNVPSQGLDHNATFTYDGAGRLRTATLATSATIT